LLYAVSCLPGCLPELSNDNNQATTTRYALLHHDCFNVLAKIDLIAFIPMQKHSTFQNTRSSLLGIRLTGLIANGAVLKGFCFKGTQ